MATANDVNVNRCPPGVLTRSRRVSEARASLDRANMSAWADPFRLGLWSCDRDRRTEGTKVVNSGRLVNVTTYGCTTAVRNKSTTRTTVRLNMKNVKIRVVIVVCSIDSSCNSSLKRNISSSIVE